MELNLEPMNPKTFFEGEGGSFHKWFPSDFPIIAQTKVGAGRLLLRPRGFAIPHNSDSSKVGYVLQGNGVVGLLFPGKADEEVVRLTKGDLIPVPEGVTSWWFNDNDSNFEVLLVGDTRNALIPGDITYVVFAGALGILQGFSSDYIKKVYNLNEEEKTILLESQTNGLIFKLKPDQILPAPAPEKHSKLVFNIYNAAPDAGVEGGGSVTAVTEKEFPFIGVAGLTAVLEKVEANAVRSPVYVADPSTQLIYIAGGSGRVQIVGFLGKIDAEVEAGQLVLVPKYFAVGKVAGEEGLECFTVITTTHPLLEELGGTSSIFGSSSAQVFQVSFNVTAELEKLLKSKITKATPLVPPSD